MIRWKTIIRNHWQDGTFLFVSLMYCLLLLRWGYVFGRDDQNEILPYALWLNNPELFSMDLFLQGIVEIVPNERWLTAHVLALLGNFLELGVFVLHLLCTLTLLLGLDRVFRHFLQNKYLSWFAVFLTLIPLYLWNPGGNDLYYNLLIPATFAKALGIWGFYFWLKDKNYHAVLLFIPATLFHPIAGIQLAMLMFGVNLFLNYKNLFKDFHAFLYPFLLYMLTAFLFVLGIKLNYDSGGSTQPNLDFFEQIFAFRNGHHYLPSQYPVKTWFVAGGSWILAFWKWKNKKIRTWLLLLLLGAITYTLGVEVLQSPTLAAFQWFKATIWLKVLGIAAFLQIIEDFGKGNYSRLLAYRLNVLLEKGLLMAGLAIGIIVLAFYTHQLPWQVPFDFGGQKHQDALVAICIEAKEATPIDAVFVHPFEVSEVPYYMERSAYISYKANLKQNAGAKIWSERIQEIYGLDYQKTYESKEKAAKNWFLGLDELTLRALRKKGINHILTYTSHELPEDWLLLQNEEWAVYEIPDEKFN